MKTYILVPLLALLCGCMSVQEKNSALLQAARTGDTATVKRMLDRHADMSTKDRYGDTPLHLALKNKHADTAELLVTSGANVNAKGALDDTPLHLSVYEGQTNMVTLLRQKGADETLLNRYGLNPAEMQGLPEIESRIVEAAQLLTSGGSWTYIGKARTLYDGLRAQQDKYLINSLVLQIIRSQDRRLQVLILAIKLGIRDSEDKLVSILMVYGDKSMAEDYLNSGSGTLAAGGRSWAAARGYRIMTGPGSHRASWGRF
jgi:hypothetical protein